MSKIQEEMKEQLRKRMKESSERRISGGGADFGILSGEDIRVFRPEEKKDYIGDIIPYIAGKYSPLTPTGIPKNPEGEAAYTIEYFIHSGIGDDERGKCICLKTWNYRCPICEHRAKLMSEGGDEELISELKWKVRSAFNWRCYSEGEDDKGVQVWALSYHQSEREFQKLAKRSSRAGAAKGNQFIFYMAPDKNEGRSISFIQGGKEDYFGPTGIKFEPRDYDIPEEDLNAAYCLEDLLTNSLPKNDDGSLNLEACYEKVKNYFYGLENSDESPKEEIKKKEEPEKIEKEQPKTRQRTRTREKKETTNKEGGEQGALTPKGLASILVDAMNDDNKRDELIEANGWTIEKIYETMSVPYDSPSEDDIYFTIDDFVNKYK